MNGPIVKPFGRFIALFIALILAVPNPAFALRGTNSSESPKTIDEIKSGLEEGKVRRFARDAILVAVGLVAGAAGSATYDRLTAPAPQPLIQAAPTIPAGPQAPQVAPELSPSDRKAVVEALRGYRDRLEILGKKDDGSGKFIVSNEETGEIKRIIKRLLLVPDLYEIGIVLRQGSSNALFENDRLVVKIVYREDRRAKEAVTVSLDFPEAKDIQVGKARLKDDPRHLQEFLREIRGVTAKYPFPNHQIYTAGVLKDGTWVLATEPHPGTPNFYGDFHLFIGKGGHVQEIEVERTDRLRDGGTTDISAGQYRLHLPRFGGTPILYDKTAGEGGRELETFGIEQIPNPPKAKGGLEEGIKSQVLFDVVSQLLRSRISAPRSWEEFHQALVQAKVLDDQQRPSVEELFWWFMGRSAPADLKKQPISQSEWEQIKDLALVLEGYGGRPMSAEFGPPLRVYLPEFHREVSFVGEVNKPFLDRSRRLVDGAVPGTEGTSHPAAGLEEGVLIYPDTKLMQGATVVMPGVNLRLPEPHEILSIPFGKNAEGQVGLRRIADGASFPVKRRSLNGARLIPPSLTTLGGAAQGTPTAGLEEKKENPSELGVGDQVEERRHLDQERRAGARETDLEKPPTGVIHARDVNLSYGAQRITAGADPSSVVDRTLRLIERYPESGIKNLRELAEALGVKQDYIIDEMSFQQIEEALRRLASQRSLTVAPPPGEFVAQVAVGVNLPSAVGQPSPGPGAITPSMRREAEEQVMRIFEGIQPASDAAVGIGPTQARNYAQALRVIAPLLPDALKRRIFVMTEDATQGLELAAAPCGLIASNESSVVIDQLRTQFQAAPQVQLFYHANPHEIDAFQKVITMWRVESQFTLVGRQTPTALRTFLQELLANLKGVKFDQVDPTTVDEMEKAVDLLIKA